MGVIGTGRTMPQDEPVRTLLAWSSGKDSAWTLQRLTSSGRYQVAGLLTTFNSEFDRVAMHAVRRELVACQAEAAAVPLFPVMIPWPCSNRDYEAAMLATLETVAKDHGVTHVAFGDLFLADVRAYREAMLRGTGLTPVFPLWGEATAELARQMVNSGLRAVITCLDPGALPESFAGRIFDQDFLDELPEDVDPCGERGEFHTFVFRGPMFKRSIKVSPGEVVRRDGFVFADVMDSAAAG